MAKMPAAQIHHVAAIRGITGDFVRRRWRGDLVKLANPALAVDEQRRRTGGLERQGRILPLNSIVNERTQCSAH
jgi:hypothetical protein